jgi:hypothetical protein
MDKEVKQMNISVNEQTQRFYLASNKWNPAIGHEIKVGKYRFCAIPLSGHINVSEVTSGAKVFEIPMNVEIMLETESKEGSIKFFNKIGESLKRIIVGTNNFDDQLVMIKKIALERLGEMPKIEEIDTDWLLEDVSDVLN